MGGISFKSKAMRDEGRRRRRRKGGRRERDRDIEILEKTSRKEKKIAEIEHNSSKQTNTINMEEHVDCGKLD